MANENKISPVRERYMERWMGIVMTVFKAEEQVRPNWEDRLRAAKDMDQTQRAELADAYARAMATEILSDISDETLEEWEGGGDAAEVKSE